MPCSVPFWPLVWLLIPSYFSLAKALKKKITQKGNPTWDSDLLQPSSKIKTKEGRKLVETSFILRCTHSMLHTWQSTHMNPQCTSRHFCCHGMRCQLPCGTKTTTHTSFNHIPFLLLMTKNCVHQRWNSHFSQCCYCRPNMNGFFSLILHSSKICCNSNQIRSYHNQHPTNQFLLLT
jgi:hypothetical protein